MKANADEVAREAEVARAEAEMARADEVARAAEAMAALLAEDEKKETQQSSKKSKAKAKKAKARAEQQAAEEEAHRVEQAAAAAEQQAAAADELLPDAYVCPITQELMNDPVFASDGHTYERQAIERWIAKNATSPKTGCELEMTMLFPNHAMRGQIREWQEAHM